MEEKENSPPVRQSRRIVFVGLQLAQWPAFRRITFRWEPVDECVIQRWPEDFWLEAGGGVGRDKKEIKRI